MMVACLCPNILAIVETQYLCQTLMIVGHYGSMRLAKWLNQPYEFGTLVEPTTFYGESCAWPTLHAAKSQEFKKLFVEAELQMREVPVKHGAPIDPQTRNFRIRNQPSLWSFLNLTGGNVGQHFGGAKTSILQICSCGCWDAFATAMTEAMNSSLDPNMIEKMLLGAHRGFHMWFITLLGGALGLKNSWLSPWDLNTKLG